MLPSNTLHISLTTRSNIRYLHFFFPYLFQSLQLLFSHSPLPLLLPLPSSSISYPIYNRLLVNLQNGLHRRNPKDRASLLLDRLRLPQTRHERRRLPQLHVQRPRTTRPRPHGEIRYRILGDGKLHPIIPLIRNSFQSKIIKRLT